MVVFQAFGLLGHMDTRQIKRQSIDVHPFLDQGMQGFDLASANGRMKFAGLVGVMVGLANEHD
ncbi:hypothetical protein CSC65_05875 [Pseudoxanthomonas daejeonensis]|uniref:Uncharacterized protein n=1 Tax=Pseudoxanthomonas daejeonensis TaxID=266062 RepID=A0ABQ6Z964_9GAMM|nr:hypothetical protein CSC65_05875 [Pseudoxanthomonas daejeonensis]